MTGQLHKENEEHASSDAVADPAPVRTDFDALVFSTLRRFPIMDRPAIPWIVLVTSLVITAVGTWGVYEGIQSHNEERLRSAMEATRNRIAARLDVYTTLLHGGSGLLAATNGSITGETFHTYAARLHLDERYPGLQGIGFSRFVRSERQDSLSAARRIQGFPDLNVTPSDPTTGRHSIVYLEPLDQRNRRAIGYDMYSDPTRREAMARARDTGTPALSGRVTLVQELAEQVQAGFLIYVPVYDGGRIPPTVEERREALDGFVFAPFRADDLFSGIFSGGERPQVAFRIYDGRPAAPDRLLHDSRTIGIAPADPQAVAGTVTMEAWGHPWTLTFAPTRAFQATSRHWLAPSVAAIGLLLSALLFTLSRAQVQAEAATRERERHLRTTLESVPVGVFVADRRGRIAFANAAARKIFMGSSEVAPEDRDRYEAWWADVLRHFGTRYEVLARALQGQESEREVPDVVSFDGTQKTILIAAFPFHNASGKVERAVAAVVDLTEQRRAREAEAHAIREQAAREAAEAREAQLRHHAAELERSNRELRDFAYVASHDLQEPLRKISAFADLLREEYGKQLDEPALYYLERMQQAALRMSRLIKDLLVFSRVRTRAQPFEHVDLNDILADVLADVAPRLDETGGRVEAGSLPTLEADPVQMRQLFQNLVDNALKFHLPDVAPLVQVRGDIEDGGGEQAPVCRIEVQDNGIGFEEKYSEKIFTPFQQLHERETYDGTGMGLAISRRIVERHAGTLEARSTPGTGSTFVVRLPLRRRGVGLEAQPVV